MSGDGNARIFLPRRRTSLSRRGTEARWRGGTILLCAEQGFGDTIQFIRYAPLVSRQGGRVIINCQADLQRLLKPMAEGGEIVPFGQGLPAFDFYCPLLSLPRLFGVTLANIPGIVPYLQPDENDVIKWRRRLEDVLPS